MRGEGAAWEIEHIRPLREIRPWGWVGAGGGSHKSGRREFRRLAMINRDVGALVITARESQRRMGIRGLGKSYPAGGMQKG